MVKLLVGEAPLMCNYGRHSESRDTSCKICEEGVCESSKHFLFEFPALREARVRFIDALHDATPLAPTIIATKDVRAVFRAELGVLVSHAYLNYLRVITESVLNMYNFRLSLFSALDGLTS